MQEYQSLTAKLQFLAPIYIENLAFFCMPFLDLAFLNIHSVEMVLIYGMMLPWFFITEISINSMVILVCGEEISRHAKESEYFRRRIQLATQIVVVTTGIVTIAAAAITTNIVAPTQFWQILPYFMLFTLGFSVYAQRKIVAIEATNLGIPRAALSGSVLALGINLALNTLAWSILDPFTVTYLLSIASSTVMAYLTSWFYIRSKISKRIYVSADRFISLSEILVSLIRPLKTQFFSSLELISSQSYTLVIIALLMNSHSDFVYVRSFLVQFFLIITATGIAFSIYCNNLISTRLGQGIYEVSLEVRRNIADIMKVTILQSFFTVSLIYTLYHTGYFGNELSDVGLKSLVIGAMIYFICEPVKASNIMLLTVIRRLHIAAVPTAISVVSNCVAIACAFVATEILNENIMIFTVLIVIMLADEIFRFSVYSAYLKTKPHRRQIYE